MDNIWDPKSLGNQERQSISWIDVLWQGDRAFADLVIDIIFKQREREEQRREALYISPGIDLKLISPEVIDETESLKIDVENIISNENKAIAMKFFKSRWFNSFYDFYFYEVDKFIQLLQDNDDLRTYFNKVTDNTHKKISTKKMLFFIEYIWFYKLVPNELIEKLLKYLKTDHRITSLNEYKVVWLNNFRSIVRKNIYLRYYVSKRLEKLSVRKNNEELENLWERRSARLNEELYYELWENLWLKMLDEWEVKKIIRERLKKIWIEYISAIERINVRAFRDIIWNDLLFQSYILSLWILKSDIDEQKKLDIWKELWLKTKNIDKISYSIEFLKQKSISNYSDIISLGKNWARDLRSRDEICLEVLNSIWIFRIQNFRLDHLKKFCRRIWLPWVPNDVEIDEEATISKIISRLLQNGVECNYSLKLKGINHFISIFRERIIWDKLFNEIRAFIKAKTSKPITLLHYVDLDTISSAIWLKVYTESEHKVKLLAYLQEQWVGLDFINKARVKEKYWKNIQFRYFFEKVWVKNIKFLSSEHVEEMKRHIESI